MTAIRIVDLLGIGEGMTATQDRPAAEIGKRLDRHAEINQRRDRHVAREPRRSPAMPATAASLGRSTFARASGVSG